MKKKILHIGISKTLGGIETYLLNLMKSINQEEFQMEFLVFYNENPDFLKVIKEQGGIIHRLTSRTENYFQNRKELKAFFKLNSDYTVIHNHIINLTYPWPIFYAPKNSKVILHSHIAKLPSNKRILFFHNFYKKRMLNRADILLACSNLAGEFMFEKERFQLITNAIDFEQYEFKNDIREKYRKEMGLNNEIVLGHIGRFEEQKNHIFLVEMFKQLVDSSELNYHLLLVGEGSLEHKIKEKAEEVDLSGKITFLGVRRDVQELLNVFDLFLLPSLYEGLPFVIVEAQVNGLKCIVSDQVSNESDFNKNISFLPINRGFEEWVKGIEVNAYNNTPRVNDLLNTEYDLRQMIKSIEMIYKN
ncbi:MAG: glycosyltransferase [Solibacillus sp.]